MYEGWIKLYRCIKKNKVYKKMNSSQRDVLIQILMMANYEVKSWTYKEEKYTVTTGQFVTSLESIRKECGSDVTIKTVRVTIDKLVKNGIIAVKSTHSGRIITLLESDFYHYESKEKHSEEELEGQRLGQRLGQSSEEKKGKDDDRENPGNTRGLEDEQRKRGKDEKGVRGKDRGKDRGNYEEVKEVKEKTLASQGSEKRKSFSYPDSFETFWKLYPKKSPEKRTTFNKWEKIVKSKGKDSATQEELIQAVKNYTKHCEKEIKEVKFRKSPKNFLEEKIYLDYIDYEVEYTPKEDKLDKEVRRQHEANWIASGRDPNSPEMEEWIKNGADVSELYKRAR